MKNHTLLAQDDENRIRVYTCRSRHIHVIYRRTNIAVSTDEFHELLDCVVQTFEYIQTQSPERMVSKRIDLTFDNTAVNMPLPDFRTFVQVLGRAEASFQRLFANYPDQPVESGQKPTVKLIPLRLAGTAT